MSFLADPQDGGELELVVWQSSAQRLTADQRSAALDLGIPEEDLEAQLGESIETGVLLNRRLGCYYPIHRGVPRLLVFKTAVSETFAEEHRQRLRDELPGFELPSATGAPGERDVLRSFSSEWQAYEWDEKSYWNLRPEQWFRCMRHVLDLESHPIRARRVLEVGIGIGATADHLSRTEGAEVVGVDLSYAVDAAALNFGTNPLLHIVQASAFALPLEPGAFDFVYSFGVLHHTYSTETAFRSVATMPAEGGHLYVWVYSPYDEERSLLRRGLMGLEKVARPVLWRLPSPVQTAAILPLVPLYMLFQAGRVLAGGPGQSLYSPSDALHAARDRFTPRFIHRHTDEELVEWFQQAGYEELSVTSRRPRPDFVPVAFTACAGVLGQRSGGSAKQDAAPGGAR
jgi:SAM-dependent methyltransferase/uncharacterized protein YbaR (Trm112 family)